MKREDGARQSRFGGMTSEDMGAGASTGASSRMLMLDRSASHRAPKRWSIPHWRILCYHAVPAEYVSHFRRQLELFVDIGYRFVGLDAALGACRADTLQTPCLTLTFDDGDQTLYRNILRVLETMRITSFLYVTTGYIQGGTTYRDDPPRPAMSRQQLQDWVAAGHGVGTHTATHAPLSRCSPERLGQEVLGSKAVLEDWLQVPVVHLSYPWGQYSRETRQFIKGSSLFESAATIDRGMMCAGYDPFRLRRDVCCPDESPSSVVNRMRLADRWYWLRGIVRRPEGHWAAHPEETWD